MRKCLLFLLLPLAAGAAEHIPWTLDGAPARIEKYRMGACSLQLMLPDGSPVPDGAQYEVKQTRHAFHFGGSLAADWKVPETDWYPEFKEHFSALFNYATIDFYWAVHAKQPKQWRYDPGSREKLDWARAQGMTLRGHPLMWHEVIPDWIASTNRPVKELDREIMEHVRRLVESYPEIDEWDLHNETPGIRLKDPNQGVRRWVESLGGPGPVIEIMVDEVREIRPEGRYILNHFTDNDPEYHKQIGYCISNKVPFDAIGIQTHMHTVDDTIAEDRLWQALETYSKYGKPIHLSEISILSCEIFPDWPALEAWEKSIESAKQSGRPQPFRPSTPEQERYQAELARDFYTLAFSHPKVEAIIWWTITDLEPWRGMPAGLLDANGKPKPVYEVLDRLINEEWQTQLKGKTSRKGRIGVNGFYGSYEITVQHDGRTLHGSFDLSGDPGAVQEVLLSKNEVKK